MVRYVPIKEILILIMCFRESYEKNTQHKRQIARCNCILSKKNIKLQLVTPPMPLEALLISENLTDSDSDGIGEGTGCNFIFFQHILTIFMSLSIPGLHKSNLSMFGVGIG